MTAFVDLACWLCSVLLLIEYFCLLLLSVFSSFWVRLYFWLWGLFLWSSFSRNCFLFLFLILRHWWCFYFCVWSLVDCDWVSLLADWCARCFCFVGEHCFESLVFYYCVVCCVSIFSVLCLSLFVFDSLSVIVSCCWFCWWAFAGDSFVACWLFFFFCLCFKILELLLMIFGSLC